MCYSANMTLKNVNNRLGPHAPLAVYAISFPPREGDAVHAEISPYICA